MRGKKAKLIRKQIYGSDFSPRFRKYQKTKSGLMIADEMRFKYQFAKGRKKFWHTVAMTAGVQ